MKRVVYREAARDDLSAIYDYIAADNPDAARRVIQSIRTAVDRLGRFERLGRAGRVAGARELVVSSLPYVVVYEISDRVEIIAVFHSSRSRPSGV